jgi:hypothetical protein
MRPGLTREDVPVDVEVERRPTFDEWLQRFLVDHDLACKHKLPPAERNAYERDCRDLSVALLAAQQMIHADSGATRRVLRIRWAMQVVMTAPGKLVRAVTRDISAGGFSALVGEELTQGEAVTCTLRVPSSGSVSSGARVLAVSREVTHFRICFAFVDLAGESRKILDGFILDRVMRCAWSAGAREPRHGDDHDR